MYHGSQASGPGGSLPAQTRLPLPNQQHAFVNLAFFIARRTARPLPGERPGVMERIAVISVALSLAAMSSLRTSAASTPSTRSPCGAAGSSKI